MVPVEIYTTPICPYCLRAKDLLRRKGVTFTEINVQGNQTRRAEMTKRANGRHTVPQIFIGAHHVGGCDDLVALDRRGGLDPLLNGGTP
ncbi:glutaredoxin 3 [Pararhodospirillum oryzae]|uniref:Glutaredoxin n=1 Tax=Pararhodospirillum oryzae TaxID=478448 RepID=A0A512H816_9PROT|nr:glutaredoxin 3 [Pararhodospirillum oryzae]GEO81592.1 glutaredoxin 3 [Pararhodospirillum oryzae]